MPELRRRHLGASIQNSRKKMKVRPRGILTEEETLRQVEMLFPRKEHIEWQTPQVTGVPLFAKEEIIDAAKNIKCRKAPGPDRIPHQAVKMVATTLCRKVTNIYNQCLTAGEFPTIWKESLLVLIETPKKMKKEVRHIDRPHC